MNRYKGARAVDANQAEIVSALRKRGHLVQSLAAVGGGVPDLLVGVGQQSLRSIRPKGDPAVFVLLEVKDGRKQPARRRLTPLEKAWHEAFKGFPVGIVECAEDAIAFVELGESVMVSV